MVSHGASSTALKSGGSRGGSGAHAAIGAASASATGSGAGAVVDQVRPGATARGQVCVLKIVAIAPCCAKDTIIVNGPRISVGDYVLTVHSHSLGHRAAA